MAALRLAPVALCMLVVLVYLPGLPGSFLFDDSHNIVDNPLVALQTLSVEGLMDAAHSGVSSYPNRGLARISFALDHYLAGGKYDPLRFKLTNIAIHALAGLLVFLLAGRLLALGSARRGASRASVTALALMAAAIWVLHPIQLTSVLYAVQRMTSLSGLFVFVGLLVFVIGRQRLAEQRPWGRCLMLAGVAAGTLLGALCKENAVLTPLFAALIEVAFFDRRTLVPQARRFLAVFYAVTVLVPLAGGAVVLAVAWEPLTAGYAARRFDVVERLLTEARVLFYYLRLYFLPTVGEFGLFHDDMAVSRGLLQPWTTLPSIVAWLLLAALAAARLRHGALWAFGLLWYLCGHLLESTVLPLELVHEHRNYVPSFGLALLLVGALDRLAVGSGRPVRIRALAGVAVAVLLAFVTHTRAGIWQDEHTLMYFTARNHPHSYRAQASLAFTQMRRMEDASAIYATLIKASVHEARPAYTLIEAAKLVREMQRRAAAGVLPSRATDAALPTSWNAPLVLAGDYLGALESHLHAEIRRRLVSEPVSHESSMALVRLKTCALSGEPACVSLLPEARDWLRAAMGNAHGAGAARANLHFSLAELEAADGRLEAAVELAGEAAQIHPVEIGYRLYQGLYLVQLGRLEDAARLIEQIRAAQSRRGVRLAEVRTLEAALATAREQVAAK